MTLVLLRTLIITFVASVATSLCVAETSTLNDELLLIDRQLLQAKKQLSEITTQMRDAKQYVTEKEMELVGLQAALRQESTDLQNGRLRHAKQRLALAKMGVDSIAARFERIQRRMEDLAGARVTLLASRDNQVQASVQSDIPPAREAVATDIGIATPLLAEPGNASKNAVPVLSEHGKLSDPLIIARELQKLERHLVTADAPTEIATHAKAFGSTIAGEVALEGLGANQFFARFTALETQSKIVVGARFKEFVRTSIDLEFTEEEIGQQFILIFDANQTEKPRAIIFQSVLMPSDEAFAAHQRF